LQFLAVAPVVVNFGSVRAQPRFERLWGLIPKLAYPDFAIASTAALMFFSA
jgi:hypothetical protein